MPWSSRSSSFWRVGVVILSLVAVACATGTTDDPSGTGNGQQTTGTCTNGSIKCGDSCAVLGTDPLNCGACGHACGTDKVCVEGACASHCPIGQLTCDGKCVDTHTDSQNCGSCGTICAGGKSCFNGSCATSCGTGQTKCSGLCTSTLTDPQHCGSCTNACTSEQICSGGTCCAGGQSGCGGLCIDSTSDVNNCGGCGIKCSGNTPYCSSGLCKACNPTVLVLGDSDAAGTQALASALTSAGLTATTVVGGAQTYAGSPAATGFGVVIVSDGSSPGDMATTGQSAIVSAQAAGVGVVMTEWGAYQASSGGWVTLQSLLLMTRTSGYTGMLTFTVEQTAHPVLVGLPSSFSTSGSMGANVGSTVTNGGTRIAGCSQCGGPGVAVRDTTGGRIVQFAHAGDYDVGAAAWSDANVAKMMVNAVRWASKCQ
jgi:hypothetical protein